MEAEMIKTANGSVIVKKGDKYFYKSNSTTYRKCKPAPEFGYEAYKIYGESLRFDCEVKTADEFYDYINEHY